MLAFVEWHSERLRGFLVRLAEILEDDWKARKGAEPGRVVDA